MSPGGIEVTHGEVTEHVIIMEVAGQPVIVVGTQGGDEVADAAQKIAEALHAEAGQPVPILIDQVTKDVRQLVGVTNYGPRLTPAPPGQGQGRYFLVVLNNDGLRHWREGPGRGVPRNRQIIAYTNTPDGADRFRGHRLREGDQLISWGAWMTGRYANRVRNEVANIQRPG